METVEVWRGQDSNDEDGNETQGSLSPVFSFPALIAPASQTVSADADSQPAADGCEVYAWTEREIRTSDVLKVRSAMLRVTEPPLRWNDWRGEYVGQRIVCERRKG